MIAALRGMTVALPIFHGSDELVYHYPTILRFSHELPFPDLHAYPAAQTPLFHLLMAYAGKVVGYELWTLRLLEVLISYLLALAVFRLLHVRMRLRRNLALALTVLFVISPYVFGQAFRLGTDNLALLFVVLAIERFEAFRESDRLGPFVVGCACAALAMLTRQSTLFLVAVAGAYALRPAAQVSIRVRAAALAAVALAVVPTGILFLNWHGLVPVGGDPSSCGLCGKGSGLSTGGLEVQTMELLLATIGLYGLVLFAPQLILWLRGSRRPQVRAAVRGPLLAALAGAILLLVFPATPGAHAAGDFWKVASHLPTIDGSSLLFWVLVPLAGAVLTVRLRVAPRPWLPAVFAACVLISAVAIHYPWQKYVDPIAVLLLLLTVRSAEFGPWRTFAGGAVLAVAFVAYAADYSAHESTPRSRAPTAMSPARRLVASPRVARRHEA